MVPEVRFLPPRVLRALGVVAVCLLPCVGFSQNSEVSRENPDVVAARARLLQELDRQIDQRRRQFRLDISSRTDFEGKAGHGEQVGAARGTGRQNQRQFVGPIQEGRNVIGIRHRPPLSAWIPCR